MINGVQHYLVVDDDSTSNLLCKLIIQKFDAKAIVASYLRPEEALEYIIEKYSKTNKSIPTILFLDVNMPTMTGFEFLDRFLKFNTEIQQQFTVYILSSSMEDFSSERKKYPSIADFLSKPLMVSHLKEIHHQKINVF
ncbi:response regulator [Salinimicrobium sp. TH3]|uniref:response regulator n=1 Tax=Salinimicrobium sp. TH3 TaxID=2997342 RepID=UPI002273BC5A|nr:response regulator [Salinimicrobium sp. TH3]MCY2687542.1 response regulator [Salinimicrobium sp. TH3]